MEKPTLGPWKIARRTGMAAGQYGMFSVHAQVYSTPTVSDGRDAICSGINNEANAILLAAAPALRNMLQDLTKAGRRALDSDIELSEEDRNKAMNQLWADLRIAEALLEKLGV